MTDKTDKIKHTYAMKLKFLTLMLVAAFSSVAIHAQGYLDGIEYYRAGRPQNAKILLERNLDKPGTDKGASYYYLGMIAVAEGNTNVAADLFAKGIAANPKYPYNYVGQGLLQLKAGQNKAAEAAFKLAEKNAGKTEKVSVDVAIARAYYSVNPNIYAKEIAKRIEKAEKKDTENPDLLIFLAEQAYDKGEYGNANGYFERAYNAAPERSEAYVRYYDILAVRNPKEAIKVLHQLLANNPQSALGQRELALAYYDMQDYKKAAEYYGKYVNNPNHFDRDESRYALLLFSNSEFQKGYDYATQLLKRDPSDFEALCFQFRNAAQLPNMKDQWLPMAEAIWQKHVADPKGAPLAQIDYNLVGTYLQQAGRYDEAIAVFDEAIKQFPNATQFDKLLAYAYIDKENYAQAARVFQNYLAKLQSPKFDDLMQEVRLAYFGAATTIDSIPAEAKVLLADVDKYAQMAIAVNPADYAPYYYLGQAKQLAANGTEVLTVAIPDYTKALDFLNANIAGLNDTGKRDGVKICTYLGNAAINAKDIAKARGYYQNALKFDPNNQAVQDWLKKNSK